MTINEMNIAIAYACGWVHKVQHPKRYGRPLPWTADYWRHESEQPFWKRNVYPRSYCHNLNDMHDAEKWLQENDVQSWYAYSESVGELFGGDVEMIHATAIQRAETFLKTLGLWIEGEVVK